MAFTPSRSGTSSGGPRSGPSSGSGGPRSGPSSDGQSFVYVKSLPDHVRVDDLKKVFAPFGQVEYVQINTNDLGSIAKIQFDSPQSANAALENPPLNLNVSLDKKMGGSFKNNFAKNGGGNNNNFRINNRNGPAHQAESRDEVGQFQVVPERYRWPSSNRFQSSNDPLGCFVQPILLQVTVPQPNSRPPVVEALEKCALCGLPTSIRCSICKTQYCSTKCQNDHWPIHKKECSEVPPAEKIESSSAPQRSLRRPLIAPSPLRQGQERNLRTEAAEEQNPNREINLRGSTLTGHNPTSPTNQHRAPATSVSSQAITSLTSAGSFRPILSTLVTDGLALSHQLFSQLDEARVGDVFLFQPKYRENEDPNFAAVFVEELTLSRVAYRMQDFCENLRTSNAFLKSSEIVVGKLVIVFDNMDGKDHFKRAFVTKISGGAVQVILIDYARVRWYPSSAPVFLDGLSQLTKYRSCGVWFEVVAEGQLKLVFGSNEIPKAKVVRKVVCTNNRTDFVEVTVMDVGGKPVADFRVHPWYKLDPLSSSLLVPEIEFKQLDALQNLATDLSNQGLLPIPTASGCASTEKEEVIIASSDKSLLAKPQTVVPKPDPEKQSEPIKRKEELPIKPQEVKPVEVKKPESVGPKNPVVVAPAVKSKEAEPEKPKTTEQVKSKPDAAKPALVVNQKTVEPVKPRELQKPAAVLPKASVEPEKPKAAAEPVKPKAAVETEKPKCTAAVQPKTVEVAVERKDEVVSPPQDVKLVPELKGVDLDPEKIKLSDLPTTKFVQGDVLVAVGFDEFTNRLIVTKPDQEDVMNIIATLLKDEVKTPLKGIPDKSQVVSCKWAHDGDDEYYRAVITSVNLALKKVKVQFIDYGNRSTENFDSLSPLPLLLTDADFPPMATIVQLADVPEISLKVEKVGHERMLSYLEAMGATFVVAKVVEVNGAQFFTLATTAGLIINGNLKNLLLGLELTAEELVPVQAAASAAPQAPQDEFIYDPKKSLISMAMDFGTEIAVTKLSADSPFDIYVYPDSRVEELGEICEQVAEKAASLQHIKGYEPKIGYLCIAKASDGELYRAVVKSQTAEGYKILFPDFGFEELVTRENIFPISPDLAALQFVPIRCVLEQFAEYESSDAALKVVDFGNVVNFEAEFVVKLLRFTPDGSGVVISIKNLSSEAKSAIESLRQAIARSTDDQTSKAVKDQLAQQLAQVEELRRQLMNKITKGN